ncbi:MAG: SpoIIE family protein phosphatase [Proteobacteria bacterium]|nr:SpoIIE family protein phosphatase [Pseudomonadota bacterium]
MSKKEKGRKQSFWSRLLCKGIKSDEIHAGISKQLATLPGSDISLIQGTLLVLAFFFVFLPSPGQTAVPLVIGYSENPPLVFTGKNGQPSGFYIDIIQYIGKKEGWQLQFRTDQWNENLKKLEENKIDLLLDIGFSEARSRIFHFNRETLLEDWAQIYLIPASPINTILDLDEKKIGMVKNDIHSIAFIQVASSVGIQPETIETKSYRENEMLLDAGKVDAIILPRIYGQASGDDRRLRKSPLMFNPIELRIAAARSTDTAVLDRIDHHLRELKSNSSSLYYRALDRRLEGIQKIVLPQWLSPTWVVAGVFGLITITFAFTLLLKRQLRIQALALEKSIAARQKQESELQVARSIQQGLLPAEPLDLQDYHIRALLQPAKAVGGDFYDYFTLPGNKLCLLIADVADKGIPAALFMAAVKTFLSIKAKDLKELRQILTAVNKEVIDNNDSCMFVTLFCGILDLQTNTMEYSLAGHEPPMLLRNNNTLERLDQAHCPALGLDEESDYTSATTTLSAGDALLLFTDGVTEAMNNAEELFGEERLQETLLRCLQRTPAGLLNSVENGLAAFTGSNPQHDDITMLCLIREK